MKTRNAIPLCLVLLAGWGCHTDRGALSERPGSNAEPIWSCALMAREIVLTETAPRDAELGIRLLRVEPDGTAVIAVDRTEETLAARPGEYFLGACHPPYNVRTFGEHGLHLVRSDPQTQSAVLIRAWSESHRPRYLRREAPP